MILRVLPNTWRKLAEFLMQAGSVFSRALDCANLSAVIGDKSFDRLTRIPSLFRGLASFGAAPVFLPARVTTQQMTHPFPKNLPLSARCAGTRPRRTDHV